MTQAVGVRESEKTKMICRFLAYVQGRWKIICRDSEGLRRNRFCQGLLKSSVFLIEILIEYLVEMPESLSGVWSSVERLRLKIETVVEPSAYR